MKLTVARKLGISFALILLLMGVNAAITYSELSSMSQIQRRMTNVRVPTLTTTEALAKEMFHASSDLRSYAIYGSDPTFAERYESSRQKDWQKAEEHLAKLQELSKTWVRQENKDRLARITADVKEFRAIQDEVQPNLQGRGEKARAVALERLKAGAAVAADLTVTMNELLKTLNEMVDEDRNTVLHANSITMTVAVISTLIGVAFGAAVAIFVSRQIGKSVAQIQTRITAIAHGDLTGEELTPCSKDEMATVVESLNLMQTNLTEIISALRQSAEQIASASEEISSSATEVAASSESQKNETTQVATAMQEMAVTVQQVSENSQLATEGALHSRETARNGGAVVESTVAAIRSLADATRETAAKIGELGKSSDQIGKIVSVIDDIADQTNLLALNAAIEAARAGEQGRGFAVVADEVRKLAERTTQATKEIGGMIAAIQTETTKAVDAMNSGLARVDAGVGTAQKAGDALKEIISGADSVQEMVTQIATAATQQSAATAQVSDNMERISAMVSQSAVNAQQSSTACQELSNLALELQHVVEKFQLRSGTRSQNSLSKNALPRQSWNSTDQQHSSHYSIQ